MARIKLGYAPTRRSIFSAPDAVKYRGLTADRLRELRVDFVDIDDINEEGPLDERPDADGRRLRDTQCGLFATGKVLRRFQVPFTYLTNCRLNDPVFARGIKDFLAVCNVVKTFKNIRILQIGPRPFDFWSTIRDEILFRNSL